VAEYYRGSSYDKKFVDAKKRGATLDELNDMSVGDMRKALEQASYVVPLGVSANVLRGYLKLHKAGKKIPQLVREGKGNIAKLKESLAAAQKSGNPTQIKTLKKELQKAGGQMQGRVSAQQAKVAQGKRALQKKAEKGIAASVGSVAAGKAINSKGNKTKTKSTGTTTKSTKTKVTTPKVAPSPNTRGGSIGRTATSTTGKARVAAKPNETSKKKKKYGKSGMGMAAYQSRTGSRR
jgi:hypothetical protein